MDIEKEREAFEKEIKEWYPFGESTAKDRGVSLLDLYPVEWALWQASANREGFVLVNAEQLNQWGHMANAAEQYGCCECFESRGYAHNLACEISSYFEPTVEQEQSNESN